MRCVIILIFLSIISLNSSAQKKIAEDPYFKIYKKNIPGQKLNQTYLIKLPADFKINQNQDLKIIRRLSPDHYILFSKNDPAELGLKDFTTANNLWKASDNLIKKIGEPGVDVIRVQLVFTSENEAFNIKQLSSYAKLISVNGKFAVIEINSNKLSELLDIDEIEFADLIRRAHDELVINNLDLSVNEIKAVQHLYPSLKGNGINASLKEGFYDKNDLDLLGRSFISLPPSLFKSTHATTMATLIGGNGNSFINGLGVAPEVKFTSSDYKNLMPDDLSVFINSKISVQNHSYGTGIENYYGAEAYEYDRQIYQNDSLIHVFSSGNSGASTPSTGVYAGILNRANLTGTFKQAKNVLVVGGTNRENITEFLSSKGPAFDGRIKPEIVSAGEDGTSGAAALSTGVVSLLQQQYKMQIGSLPSSALLKSILINSADDIGALNVDFENGYGKLNALEAIKTIDERRYQSGIVTSLQDYILPLEISPSTSQVKISLAWNDLAAPINSAQALVNNLDLWLEDSSGNIILPWVLSSFPNPDSLSKPAVRGRDSINNIEQVTFENPVPGNYTIHVKAKNLQQNSQQFHLSYQTNQANTFQWTYPLLNEKLFSGKDNHLRWKSTYKNAPGILSVSYDDGISWSAIGLNNGNSNFFKWSAPQLFSKAILKMSINGLEYRSQSFSISKPLSLKVGFNCTDGALLVWPKQPNAQNYTIYTIKDNILQALQSTEDTVLKVSNSRSSDYFAVSANSVQGFEGLRSFTINLNSQGVDCYFKTFLANNGSNDNIVLNLSLGTTSGLKNITWEKLTSRATFSSIGLSLINTGSLMYSFDDLSPKTGIQYYRAVLETENGTLIYSDTISAIYLKEYQFTLYPNPATESFSILAGTIDDFELSLYNSAGQKMSTEILNNLTQSFSVADLKPGIYVCIITLKGKPVYRSKLIKT
ncbi:S8 family peptidase [Daejeonella oryzae]|uniref:S8 family peptidase n=1 Tax=Daejeonella oryzae TaxID=1122943 RepID=UPI0004133FB0|nr:S8 family serine peptidase [Daejeonella oryzae]